MNCKPGNVLLFRGKSADLF